MFSELPVKGPEIPASPFSEKERTAQNWFILGFTQNVVAFAKGFQKIVEFAHLKKNITIDQSFGKSIITIKNRLNVSVYFCVQ